MTLEKLYIALNFPFTYLAAVLFPLLTLDLDKLANDLGAHAIAQMGIRFQGINRLFKRLRQNLDALRLALLWRELVKVDVLRLIYAYNINCINEN